MRRLLAAACIVASLNGCAQQHGQVAGFGGCPPGVGVPLTIYTLFFGRAIRGRADLTDNEWQIFLDTTISPNLPNGYTVMDARGGWFNPTTRRTIKETTKVLVVALPEVPDSLPAINRIRTAYQLRFRQQLVGMTAQTACGEF